MSQTIRIAVTLLTAAITVCADAKLPVLRVGNEVYTNVTVLGKSTTDLYFTHARGMGNAKLKDMAPDLQEQFGYDPIKADETARKQAEAGAAYRKEILAGKRAYPARAPDKATEPADIPVRELHARSFRGGPSPRLVVERWLTAQPDYTGKFLLVDFWATWCGPCRRSIPKLNALHAKFKDRLVIVGLSNETEREIRAMKAPAIDYYVAIDTTGTMNRAVEVRGIPHALLIDPDGIVRFEGHPGYLTPDAVAGLLAKYSR